MGTRTIVISAAGFRRDYEARVYIPDPIGHEPDTSYNARVDRYLDQLYGVGKWHEPDSTTATRSMLRSLEIADHTQAADGQLYRLRRKATRSLLRLDKLERPKRK